MGNKFERKEKENKPVLAICYDFDKTLSPDDMQAQGYIQSVGLDVTEFWHESNELAENNGMDYNLAYMYKMLEEAEGKHVFNKEMLEAYGAKVQLFDGVEEWFQRIRKYGEENGVIVEHYIISSGLKEMIEGTKIAKEGAFTKIYASSFYYNEKGVAKWPAQAVNYTNKTQFLFRISKGVLDVNDPGVNEPVRPENVRVPFRNMVYIGDSDTDVPCMRVVTSNGGYAIGVYNPESNDKSKVHRMLKDNRIRLFAPADYTKGSELDVLLKMIIEKTKTNEKIEEKCSACVNEILEAEKNDERDKDEQEQDGLIACLVYSTSFNYTHYIISMLSKYEKWSQTQKERVFQALKNNHQIKWIIGDIDVYNFYNDLVKQSNKEVKFFEDVKGILDSVEETR